MGAAGRRFESDRPDQSSFGAERRTKTAAAKPERKRRAKTGGLTAAAPNYDSARQSDMTAKFYYVYILRSEGSPDRHYTGFTEDLESRLPHHNGGGDPHTAKYRPWKIKTAVAFTEREQALAFERYLKTSSGRAFAKKRL